MNNIHHALYYLQPQGKMLPTPWRLFGDKTVKVQFGPQQQWRNDKRRGHKLHTLPEDEQHPSPLVLLTTTGKDMLLTLWQLFGDNTFKVHFELQQQWHIKQRKGIYSIYTQCQRMNNIHHALYYVQPQEKMLPTLWHCSGTKGSRYILNYNNNDVLTKGSYTQYQRMNKILHTFVLLTTTEEDVAYSVMTFWGKNVQVHFELQQQWHLDKRKGHKLHTLPEDEQHPPRLVLSTTTEEDGTKCTMYRYVLNPTTTGRQLPPLSSVLYGIISGRRSVLAA